MSTLSRVLLLTRHDVFPQAVKFYTQALGLPIRTSIDFPIVRDRITR